MNREVIGEQKDECEPSYRSTEGRMCTENKSPERTNVNRVIRAQKEECEPSHKNTEGRM